jgi:hypothetical protein
MDSTYIVYLAACYLFKGRFLVRIELSFVILYIQISVLCVTTLSVNYRLAAVFYGSYDPVTITTESTVNLV